MVAELRLDHVGHLAALHRERGVVELRHHHAASEPAERAAVLRAGAVAVLLRGPGERLAGRAGVAAPFRDDARADCLDLVERLYLVRRVQSLRLHENVLRQHLRGSDERAAVLLVVRRDLLLGGLGHAAAGLLHERVHAAALRELLPEILLAHLLLRERLQVVLASAQLVDHVRHLLVNRLLIDGQVKLLRSREQQFGTDRLFLRPLHELFEVLLDLLLAHAVRHVELHQAVKLELHRLAGDGLAVHIRLFHWSVSHPF